MTSGQEERVAAECSGIPPSRHGGSMRKKILTCMQPDHDVPSLICGAPLPCPYHTAQIDLASKSVTVPADLKNPPMDELQTLTKIFSDAVLKYKVFHRAKKSTGDKIREWWRKHGD